jgi:hypothetical protein
VISVMSDTSAAIQIRIPTGSMKRGHQRIDVGGLQMKMCTGMKDLNLTVAHFDE